MWMCLFLLDPRTFTIYKQVGLENDATYYGVGQSGVCGVYCQVGIPGCPYGEYSI